MVKVLVVGATGFLGNLIAKEAVKLDHQVTVLVSEDSQTKKKDIVDGLKAAGVQIKTGSLESEHKDLVDVLKSVEVVGWRLSTYPMEILRNFILEHRLSHLPLLSVSKGSVKSVPYVGKFCNAVVSQMYAWATLAIPLYIDTERIISIATRMQ